MNDEELLAAILLAAAAFLLILIVVILSVIISCTGSNKKKQSSSEIPTSTIPHSSYNYGQENDAVIGANQNIGDRNEESTAHTEAHKADWPTTYDRYAISRSYVVPKKGEISYHDNQSDPNSNEGTSSEEINHKTFSEEVLLGVNDLPHPTTQEPSHNMETGSHTATRQPNSNGVWKHRDQPLSIPPTSHHSLDGHSITSANTASYPRDSSHVTVQKPSYYSTFKKHQVYISPTAQLSTRQSEQSTSQRIPSQQNTINSTHNTSLQKEKLHSYEDNPSDRQIKIFKFNIS